MAPAVPSVQGLALWVGADLTAAGLAPQGPSVQGLARRVEADLPEAGDGTGRVSRGLRSWVGVGPAGGLGWQERLRVSGGQAGMTPQFPGVGEARWRSREGTGDFEAWGCSGRWGSGGGTGGLLGSVGCGGSGI
ncbi:hypothetical protein GCM10010483_57330 [Actinokineospora diospyrosa]